MQALKSLVILLGVLIFAGLGVIGVTLYNRATTTDDEAATAAAGAASSLPEQVFGTVRLDLPSGSEVLDMRAADGRLLLRVRTPTGLQRVHIVSLTSGKILGKVEIGSRQE